MSKFIVRPDIDVVSMLKAAGYSTYVIRKSKVLGESTVQKFRGDDKQLPSWAELAKLCDLLHVSPVDLIAFQADDGTVTTFDSIPATPIVPPQEPIQAAPEPTPQHAQATHPDTPPTPAASTPQPPEGYTLIPDRPGLEPIKVLLPVDKQYNQRIYAAVKQGRATSGAMYVMAALDKQLAADEADEKRKLDMYFAAMDDDY